MRIIAGKYRGLTLFEFSGEKIRPTPDRVKESLFQIIEKRIAGASVLDLFCGSGALGIECLSRGAGQVFFNDFSIESIKLLKKNLSRLKLEEENFFITKCDYMAYLKGTDKSFSLIFCDPPYRESYLFEILEVVKSRKLLKEGGLLLYESEREEEAPKGWKIQKRAYGRVKIYFLECEEE